MFTVILNGLEFYAYGGVPEEERVVGHRYRVDLEMQVEGTADRDDELGGTVDYAAAAKVALSIADNATPRTVERLARAIGDELLQRFPAIASLTVTLLKRLPPMPAHAAEAGVRISLDRGS